ncbi:WhiB family transcriptional regulator [Micromonospora coerulea]|uniref:WhiB family transcriptional regulator n=1 Tax=Micromonospora coerulea TaxID=47856 RepID=UPI0019079991|nr:WhiB family transcriptional regulator [Micromonospora veneta]
MSCQSNPDMFFDPTREAEAATVCAGCPLVDGCRIKGQAEEYGVWGGSTPLDRAVARFKATTPASRFRVHAFTTVVELAAERGHETPAQVAAATGLAYWAVAKRMEGSHTYAEMDAEVSTLRADGLTLAEIGRRTGYDRNQVYRAVNRITQAAGMAA